MKSQKWYQIRLARHFVEHYSEYEDVTEYFVDPAPNQWLFAIPELNIVIELTCHDTGNISTEYYPL